ncbi:MAG: hypothetical protein QOH50_5488 [Kribbellaceae bacterium]|nr:hypothetical protein [Kribbellaceae bacterium]
MDLLDTRPILWIPSRIWFEFLSQRLQVLYEAHGKLWTKMPSNYGVASGLYSFLMQSVIFTPPRVNSYVRETLAVMNYKRHCDMFGMFFVPLDDPDQPWTIEDLPEIDNVEVRRVLKLSLEITRKPQPMRQKDEDEDDSCYPLGEAPTWKQIATSLRSDPTILIPRWEEPVGLEWIMDSERGSAESHAGDIFILFTSHMWILLNPSWRTRPEIRINPTTVSEALACWSVDGILSAIIDMIFKPCPGRMQRGPGRPMLALSERRMIYFPHDNSQGLAKVWKRLGEAPGYIYEYRRVRRRLEEEGRNVLDETLEFLLGLCQCLPDSSRNQSGGSIWTVESKKIAIITNPRYYRLKKIGSKPSTTKKSQNIQGRRAAPAHRNARSTAIEMMVNEDIPEEVAKQAYRASRRSNPKRDKRSAKSRNRRVPPPRKKRQIEPVASNSANSDDDNEDRTDVDDDGSDHEGMMSDSGDRASRKKRQIEPGVSNNSADSDGQNCGDVDDGEEDDSDEGEMMSD